MLFRALARLGYCKTRLTVAIQRSSESPISFFCTRPGSPFPTRAFLAPLLRTPYGVPLPLQPVSLPPVHHPSLAPFQNPDPPPRKLSHSSFFYLFSVTCLFSLPLFFSSSIQHSPSLSSFSLLPPPPLPPFPKSFNISSTTVVWINRFFSSLILLYYCRISLRLAVPPPPSWSACGWNPFRNQLSHNHLPPRPRNDQTSNRFLVVNPPTEPERTHKRHDTAIFLAASTLLRRTRGPAFRLPRLFRHGSSSIQPGQQHAGQEDYRPREEIQMPILQSCIQQK